MKKKLLIVNADDFGMSEEISDGIIKAHLDGIVTSTSLMVNMPDAKRAVLLAQQTPSLDVGLHLNITEGCPILPPEKLPTLVSASGDFLPQTIQLAKLRRFKVDRFQIEAEFSAQFSKMLDMGITPTHLDSHHHIHIYPLSAWAFKSIGEKFGVYKIRASRYRIKYNSGNNTARSKVEYRKKYAIIALQNVYKVFIQKFLWYKMISPEYRIILWPRSNLVNFEETWVRYLSSLPCGTFEADCHPGYENIDAEDPWSERRKQELDAITSPVIWEAIRRYNIDLINFNDLK